MNLSLTEEQLLIKSSAEKFFLEKFPFENRLKLINSEKTISDTITNASIEYGWTSLPFKEKYGGLEGSVTDIMTLIEVFGSYLSIDPYIFYLLMPGKVLEEMCDEDKKNNYLNKLINGKIKISFCFAEPGQRYNHVKINSLVNIKNAKYYITGKKSFVVGGNLAEYIIIPTKSNDNSVYLFIIKNNHKDLISKTYRTMDDSFAVDYEFDNLELNNENLLAVLNSNDYQNKLEDIIDFITMACCSDCLGIVEKMYELTLSYVKTREQFGRKIGSFQVIQHRLVDMYIRKEEMRSLNYMGQLSFDEKANTYSRKKNISLNKIFLSSHAKNLAQDCIQLHGGMGVANEMKIGHYFKRLTYLSSLFGNLEYHYQRYSENDKD